VRDGAADDGLPSEELPDADATDVGDIDSAPPSDATPATDGADALVSPCATPHVWCDDFDLPVTLGSSYVVWKGGDGLTLRYDDTVTRSAPRALAIEATSTTPGAAWMLGKTYQLPTPTTGIRVEFDLYAETIPTEELALLYIKDGSGSTFGGQLDMSARAGGFRVHVGGTSVLPEITPRSWTRVQIDAYLHPTAGGYAVRVDGVVIASRSGFSTSTRSGTYREVMLGGHSVSPVQKSRILVDNLKIGFL
jgi:hypothetical protein